MLFWILAQEINEIHEKEDMEMSCSRREFVKGVGSVVIFTVPLMHCGVATGKAPVVRYAMIHDEALCNGCNLCTEGCRRVNRVPDGNARLSIAHIPVSDDENETMYHFFRHSCQHCDDAPCINVCPTGASGRDDETGIVNIDRAKCIGCSYCVSACPYEVRYINRRTNVADKCDFCLETRLKKGFPPICVSVCPQKAMIFGREDSAEVQDWLKNHDYYLYQLEGAGQPHLYRRFGEHLIRKDDVV